MTGRQAQQRLLPLGSLVSLASEWCQRWAGGAHSWRHRSQGGFDQDRYHVTTIDEMVAKRFVVANHYSGTYPAALGRWGLWEGERRLVGVAVLAVPMNTAVLTNVFPGLEAIPKPAGLPATA